MSTLEWMIVWVRRQVLAGKLFLVAQQILRTALVAIDRPFVGAAGKACESDVHVVGRSAHQADRVFGDAFEAAMAALKVFRATAGSCG